MRFLKIEKLLLLEIIVSTVGLSQSIDSIKDISNSHYAQINSNSNLLLDTRPQDAYVFYHDSLIGNTPIFINSKFDELLLRKKSFYNLTVSLNEIKSGIPFQLVPKNVVEEESFFEKDLFKFLTAGIVVFGGVTAYFKLKADDKFESYELTGNSKMLDETRKYDLISGISFAVLQINFGLLLYYFLIE